MNRVWLVIEMQSQGYGAGAESVVAIFDSEGKAKEDVEDRQKQLLECGQIIKHFTSYSIEERVVQ